MRSECLLQRFRPYLAPKSPSRPPEAQIEEELVVLNARPRWTVGSAIGKFTTQNPAVYHPQADKISISLPGPLPVRSNSSQLAQLPGFRYDTRPSYLVILSLIHI